MTTHRSPHATPDALTLQDVLTGKVVAFAAGTLHLLALGILTGIGGLLTIAGFAAAVTVVLAIDAAVRAMPGAQEPADTGALRILAQTP